jgi:hypothetical protein
VEGVADEGNDGEDDGRQEAMHVGDPRLLYENAPVTVNETNYILMNYIHTHDLKVADVQPLLSLINSFLPDENNLVSSKYKLFKEYQLTRVYEIHRFCVSCLYYCGTREATLLVTDCPVC